MDARWDRQEGGGVYLINGTRIYYGENRKESSAVQLIARPKERYANKLARNQRAPAMGFS